MRLSGTKGSVWIAFLIHMVLRIVLPVLLVGPVVSAITPYSIKTLLNPLSPPSPLLSTKRRPRFPRMMLTSLLPSRTPLSCPSPTEGKPWRSEQSWILEQMFLSRAVPWLPLLDSRGSHILSLLQAALALAGALTVLRPHSIPMIAPSHRRPSPFLYYPNSTHSCSSRQEVYRWLTLSQRPSPLRPGHGRISSDIGGSVQLILRNMDMEQCVYDGYIMIDGIKIIKTSLAGLSLEHSTEGHLSTFSTRQLKKTILTRSSPVNLTRSPLLTQLQTMTL